MDQCQDVKTLIEKFFVRFNMEQKRIYGMQILKDGVENIEFSAVHKAVTLELLAYHFNGKKVRVKGAYHGAIGVRLSNTDDKVTLIAIDSDKSSQTIEIKSKLCPILERHQVDYLIEESGTNADRMHLWLLVNCDKRKSTAFLMALLKEAGMEWRDYPEIFPLKRPNNFIRLAGGFHLRNDKVNGVCHRGIWHYSPEAIIESFLELEEFSSTRIDEYLTSIESAVPSMISAISVTAGPPKTEEFRFLPRKLNLPALPEPAPYLLIKPATNCQALNTLVWRCVNERLLDDSTGCGHSAGMVIGGICAYNHSLRSVGREWAEGFFELYRTRDWKHHSWVPSESDVKAHPVRYYPTCEFLESNFDMCGDCPFRCRDNFRSPRQFCYPNAEVVRERVNGSDVSLITHKHVRESLFPKLERDILQSLGIGVNQ